jgi:NAD+ kinase
MKTVGVIANLDKPGTRELLGQLKAKADAYGLELVYDLSCSGELPDQTCVECTELFRQSEAILTLGGDGTLLSAVQQMGDRTVPLLGVNFGKLGFLTSVTQSGVDSALQSLAEDTAIASSRTLLECRTDSETGPQLSRALNDVVLSWGTSSHIAHLHVQVDGEHLTTYTCDGLILSTPTGSTGHSLSAGGPILSPDSHSLVLSPICPHSMTVRPVVLPSSATIRIELDEASKPLVLACDGQPQGEMKPGDHLEAKLGRVSVDLLHVPGYSYWEVLRTKLHWRGSNVE